MFTISRTTLVSKFAIIFITATFVFAGSAFIRYAPAKVAAYGTEIAAPKRTKINVSRTGKTVIKVSDAIALKSENAVEQTNLRPLALAMADFDEDGSPDLVTGLQSAEGGVLRIQRGNQKAVFPDASTAANELPFFSVSKNLPSEVLPDFIVTGDFNADGHADILLAQRNNSVLNFFSGDGKGNFAEPQIQILDGTVTTLAAGDINRQDGATDLAIGINAPEGARALLFSSAQGAWAAQPEEVALQNPVTALAFGTLTNSGFSDLAIAAGSELIVLQGRAQKAIPLRKMLPFAIEAMEIGNFSTTAFSQLGVLTKDGAVYLLAGGQAGSANRRAVSNRATWQPELFFAPTSTATESLSASATHLIRAHISNNNFDDLIVVRHGASPLQILSQQQAVESNQVAIAATSEIVTALPARVNSSARQGLLLLRGNESVPSYVAPEAAMTFTVNSTLDISDRTPGDGVCGAQVTTEGPLVCTLRAAIEEANANLGPDLINFNIGAGTQTITVNSSLPNVTETLMIDGTPQGTAPTTQQIEITPSGNFSSARVPLLTLNSDNNSMRKLVLTGSTLAPIVALAINGNSNLVEGSTIQSWVSGISIQGANAIIGGTVAAARNLISNNSGDAITIAGGQGNKVIGNYLGTDSTGTKSLANGGGITISSPANVIGGTTATERNVISGNLGDALWLNQTGNNNLIQGNFIGVDSTGSGALGNGVGTPSPAIIIDRTSNNTIGGIAAGARNIIANNAGIGVSVVGQLTSAAVVNVPINNRINGNSIYNNGNLGIDLGGFGVTQNDANDTDTGANNLQNFPVLSTAAATASGTLINGTLNSTPNTQFRIEFFANGACDPSGYGEGEQFLGSSTVTTNASGNANITFTANPTTPIPVGRSITATATDPNGNTSEFSACAAVQEIADLAVTQTVTPNPALSPNQVTYTITVTNNGPSVASFPVVTIRPPSILTNVTCTAPAGWSCNNDGAFFASTTNFAPGSIILTIRGTAICLPQDTTLVSNVVVSNGNATDPDSTNNTSILNSPIRGARAIANVIYDSGGTSLSLGPVVAGAVTPIPSGTFTLENTGCLPMVLNNASFIRAAASEDIAADDIRKDDSRIYALRIINADNTETTINPTNNTNASAPRVYSINRTLQPGERMRYRVLFNPPLPLFAGKFGRVGEPITANNNLPDAVASQLIFNFVTGSPLVSLGARESVGDVDRKAVFINGRVATAVQFIARDGFTIPAAQSDVQAEAGTVIIFDRLRDEFRIGVSLYDANRNVSKITYQFFDTYGQVASSVIEVPVTDSITASSLLAGQPYTIVQTFTGAAKRPDVTSVRVSVTDAETTIAASSNSTLSIAQSAPVRESSSLANSDTIQLLPLTIAPLQNSTIRNSTINRATTIRVIKNQ